MGSVLVLALTELFEDGPTALVQGVPVGHYDTLPPGVSTVKHPFHVERSLPRASCFT